MTPAPGSRLAGDDGAIAAFVAIVAVALLMVAGLVYDGGQVIQAHVRAQDLAGNAARVGAQEVGLDALRSTGQPFVDASLAEASALAYLKAQGHGGTVSVDGARVTVSVTITQPMKILPLPPRTVTATASATAMLGVTGGEPDA